MSQPAAAPKPQNPAQQESPLSRLVSLAKRRGFVFPASEIYGGLNGFWDFGPLGVQLKNNLRDAWWHSMVECPPLGPDGKPLSIVGLDSSIIQHPQTWVASGHVAGFNDLMTDCRETKLRYRADHVICVPAHALKADGSGWAGYISAMSGEGFDEAIEKKAKKIGRVKSGKVEYFKERSEPFTKIAEKGQTSSVIGPDAENEDMLTEPRPFSLMFESHAGPIKSEENKVYLRPETAQGIFLNYKNVLDSTRVRPPFGIAQVGKAFRNEVTPRNFIFRSREFEQMEMEFFCHPDQARTWYEFWVNQRLEWWQEQGLGKSNLLRRDHEKEELSHYSSATADVEYRYPFTAPDFGELEGIAWRGNFDLTQHQEHSKTKLEYVDQENNNERYLPHVIEPASGLTRGVLALLCEGYQFDESRASPEWLKIKPSLAPIKLGIFPLVNKDGMPEVAEKLYMDLRKNFTCQYDAKQAIGKRYARMDEAGTPFCLTIDGETLTSQTVTVRDRDTAQQERVALSQVEGYLKGKL